MGYQIIIQEETDAELRDDEGELDGFEPGKYCIFSSNTRTIVSWNLTREDVIAFFVDMAKEDAELGVKEKLEKVDAGLPAYYQFTKPFKRALELSLEHDAETAEEEEES